MRRPSIFDIKVKFGGKHAPKDDKAIELFKQAYKGEIKCYVAMIKVEGIKTFSNHIPKIKVGVVRRFQQKDLEGMPPPIHVYPQNGKFIMSDDYEKYHLYIITGHRKIPCIVLGEAEGEYILAKSEPFQLQPPPVEFLKEEN